MPSLYREDFRGILAASYTPLKDDESLDTGACEALHHTLLDEGQPGLYLAGGTGEEYAVDDAVRVGVFQIGARVAAARGKGERMIAHIGGVPTRRARALARAAAEAGCDAVAAIPPHGGRYSYDELSDYYRTLARDSALPLFVYHIPDATGYDFEREMLSRWLELPNVAGMKFTHYDLFKLERLCTRHPDKILFTGSDQMLMHGLACGAVGAIGSTYNLLGRVAIKIHAAVCAGNIASARQAQGTLNGFIEHLRACGGLRGLKHLVARRRGWAHATSPSPGLPVATETVDTLERALETALLEAGVA